MRIISKQSAVFATLTGLGVVAFAQAPIVYPAKGQTAEQQQKDSGECAAWAKQNTGIDPVALAAAPPPAAAAAPPAQTGPSGARLRGAAKGAAAGAIVGEIADDDASEGAAIGAATGAMAGGSAARRGKKQAAEQQQKAAADQQKAAEAKKQEQLATYNRATGARMEGRGYTIK